MSKKPIKDWIIIFFFKGYLSGFTDSILVAYGILSYPVRLMPDVFSISILFDLVIFPVSCIAYNQTSYRSKLLSCIVQAFLYSLPITLLEFWAERNSLLIQYHRWWTVFHSYFFLTVTFILIRGLIALIRKYSKEKISSSTP
ncbi:CBO0543 family protein [Paenibacillus silvisoli]|uniref:CBO0543 family protein n=1 Tax=Paenibacillus silvisoli TaxID=3110539 RepID=UPI0038994F1A